MSKDNKCRNGCMSRLTKRIGINAYNDGVVDFIERKARNNQGNQNKMADFDVFNAK